MKFFEKDLEKRLSRKIREFDNRLKTSFGFIRQDIDEMRKSVDNMKLYLKKREKQDDYARKQDNKIRSEFRKDVNEFSQKIKQLRLALEKVKEIENEVVVKSDLARIEDGIKTSFRDNLEDFKFGLVELTKRVESLEKNIVSKRGVNNNTENRGFFSFLRKNKNIDEKNTNP